MSLPVRISGLFCIVGGFLFAFAPTLDGLYPSYLRIAAISPVFLLIGSFGLWKWTASTNSYDPATKAGHLLLTVSLLGSSVIGGIYAYVGSNAYVSVALFPGALAAALGVAVGTGVISMWAIQNDEGPVLLMTFFMVIPFFDPLINHIISSVGYPYGFSFYGLAWVLVGVFIALRGTGNIGAEKA